MPETRPTVLPPDRGMRKELQDLYARRSAIDDLIQSLEEYDRFRALRMERSPGTVRLLRHSLRIA
jgi:hypothetical protein